MKHAKIIFILILLVFLTSCAKKEVVFIDNGIERIKIIAEVANTEEKRAMGLMFREDLDEDSGMLFIFNDEYQYTFWMKNTLIPLDIIFINENSYIVDIIRADPCEEEPCKSYKPKKSAKYVLEVNGNFTTENNIKAGDKLIIDEEFIENAKGFSK